MEKGPLLLLWRERAKVSSERVVDTQINPGTQRKVCYPAVASLGR